MELTGPATRVELAQATAEQGSGLGSRLQSLGRDENIYLVVKDLATQEQPGVVFDIYLDLPPGSAPAKDSANFVGTINFYAAARPSGPEGAPPSGFRSFNVTSLLQNLQKQNQLSDPTVVTVIPRSGRANPNAKPVIGKIELVTQRSTAP